MCGIAGIVQHDATRLRATLESMCAAQKHRGPDDHGASVVPFGPRHTLGLGHRRLAIIDLTPAGHEPMIHPVTGDQIVFNGEIYNFQSLRELLEAEGERFRGHGDAEVLLHALARWGEKCLPRLEGMYAFAFYNAREQTLLLARDPLGIKPLYVARTPGGLVFASEVRAVLASGAVGSALDTRAVAGLLAYGAPQQPQTVFAAIRSFPAGHYQVITPGNLDRPVAPSRFWHYPDSDDRMTEGQAVEALRATLDEAVRDHLIADVPVGVFLSSGLDSSIVAHLAARRTPQLRAFTVGFADQPDMSEAALAAATARHAGLTHVEITINGPDAEHAMIAWLEAIDQPSMDGLNTYIISQAVRREGITVALSGQGGDELFGGYPTFADVPRLQSMLGWIAWAPVPVRRALLRGAGVGRSEAVRQKLLDIAGTEARVLDLYLQRRRAMSNRQLEALGFESRALDLDQGFLPAESIDGLRLDGHPGAAISRLECHFFQGNMLLRDVDCSSMAHGLEIRVPILDQRVIDLANRIPGRLRFPAGGESKHLLRVAFGAMLRPEILQQKKRGFFLPIQRWMHGPVRDFCESALRQLKQRQVMRADGIDAIWKSFLRDPESPIWTRAFVLCVLGSYLDKMKVA